MVTTIKYRDEQISEHLKYIVEELLNLEDKHFFIPETRQNLTIKQIIERIKLRDYDWIIYQKWIEEFMFNELPNILNRAKKGIETFGDLKVLNIEGLSQEIKELREYVEQLEKEIEKRDIKIDKLTEALIEFKDKLTPPEVKEEESEEAEEEKPKKKYNGF